MIVETKTTQDEIKPGTYNLVDLLANLTGNQDTSTEFTDSLSSWKDLTNSQMQIEGTTENKFVKGMIFEQSAEPLRPFVEIISNSIDAIRSVNPDGTPLINIGFLIHQDGSIAILISDKGQGTGMDPKTFLNKYLPPTASTKDQATGSIGQMGVGANQQYSLIRRPKDMLIVSTSQQKTPEEPMLTTLMKVTNPRNNDLQATIGSGQSNGEAGTFTLLNISAETVQEIGLTVPGFIGYLKDRFGSLQNANLTVDVTTINSNNLLDLAEPEPNSFSKLTPDKSYSIALRENYQRAFANSTEINHGIKFPINSPESNKPILIEATIPSKYAKSEVDRNKTVTAAISTTRSDTCLVYLDILGIRFNTPIVVEGSDLPETIDINLDYRVGQIAESRNEMRLTESDYLRIAQLIERITYSNQLPKQLDRLKVLTALTGITKKLDDQSPNKLREDLNLIGAIKRGVKSNATDLAADLWPTELSALLEEGHGLTLVPLDILEISDFHLREKSNLQRIDFLTAPSTEIYATNFPINSEELFVWAKGVILINSNKFPNLLATDPKEQQAERIRLEACIDNLQNAHLPPEMKLPVTPISLVAVKLDLAANMNSLNNPTSLAFNTDEPAILFPIVRTHEVTYGEVGITINSTYQWDMEERKKFLLANIIDDREIKEPPDLITALDLDEDIISELAYILNINRTSMFSFSELAKPASISWDELMALSRALYFDGIDLIAKGTDYIQAILLLSPEDMTTLHNRLNRYQRATSVEEILKSLLRYKARLEGIDIDTEGSIADQLLDSFVAREFDYINYDFTTKYIRAEKEYPLNKIYGFYTHILANDLTNYSMTALKALFICAQGDLKRFDTALTLTQRYNLSTEDVGRVYIIVKDKLSIADFTSVFESSDAQVLATYLKMEAYVIQPNDSLIFSRGQFQPQRWSALFAIPDNQVELFKRKILQQINSVEPGLGGSVSEAIKNSVAAIQREPGANNKISVEDYYEVDLAGNSRFGFRLTDVVGWADASNVANKLTIPGIGEGIHGVHFLTLLKEYDEVKVRATDFNGQTAYIRYTRVLDLDTNKVTGIDISQEIVNDQNLPPGTVIEASKPTSEFITDSIIFRDNLAKFVKNIPTSTAQVLFHQGTDTKLLNSSASLIISPTTVPGLGEVEIITLKDLDYQPEVTIEHLPIKFNLGSVIDECDIPPHLKKLLTSGGFTMNIARLDPTQHIVRSTKEFTDAVTAKLLIKRYIESNWVTIFEELFKEGKIDVAKSGILPGDVWKNNQPINTRALNLAENTDLSSLSEVELTQYLFYAPLIVIPNQDNNWSIAAIIADQYKAETEQRLRSIDIPYSIREKIKGAKINVTSNTKIEEPIEYVDHSSTAARAVALVTEHIYPAIKNYLANRSNSQRLISIPIQTHTGGSMEAFYDPNNRLVSYNNPILAKLVTRAKNNDLSAYARISEVLIHELIHAQNEEDESFSHHNLGFYKSISEAILGLSTEQISAITMIEA